MANVYIHFNGTTIGKSNPFQSHSEQIDRWFPEKPTNMDTLNKIATDSVDTEVEIFHKAYDASIGLNIGGILHPHVHIGVDVFYKGTIEYWKTNGTR